MTKNKGIYGRLSDGTFGQLDCNLLSQTCKLNFFKFYSQTKKYRFERKKRENVGISVEIPVYTSIPVVIQVCWKDCQCCQNSIPVKILGPKMSNNILEMITNELSF